MIREILVQAGWFYAWGGLSAFIFLRYLLPAGAVFGFFYIWRRRVWLGRKIQQKYPRWPEIRREIGYSLCTAAIFGGIAACMIFLKQSADIGRIYHNFGDYPWWYFAFSLVMLVVAHDTYFYWMHRLIHHPRLFAQVHRVHHLSHNPTPFASFSFHPLESALEFAIIPILVLVVPVHTSALFLFTLWSTAFNIMGHCGFEIFPAGFARSAAFCWINTPTHHNLHHQDGRYNYSLYFNCWDRWMGTNHPRYRDQLEEVVRGKSKAAISGNPSF